MASETCAHRVLVSMCVECESDATTAALSADAECNACGAPLDGDCDHCCVACLDGNACPACEGPPPGFVSTCNERGCLDHLAPAPPTSLDMTATRAVLDDVLAERGRQHAKWGQQDLPDGTGDLAEYDFATLMRRACETAFAEGRGTWRHILEEEIAEAMDETDDERLETELIQVAAVAVQWIEAIRRRRAKADVDAAVRAQLGGGQ